MHNLNVSLASTAASAVNSLLVESTCTTPRTPEILNSLIAMTNPMDGYSFGNAAHKGPRPPTNLSSDSNSSSSSQMESPTTNNPPSVQQTCSQLIKAGLKLSIEQKRKHQSDGEDLLDLDKCKRIKKNDGSESDDERNKSDGMQNWTWYENDDYSKLTPEDEERRRRRRERNKIAATKCRLKKREKTANLVNESETLETQNQDLKGQLKELQTQKQTLVEMLSLHRPQCQHNITAVSRDTVYRLPAMEAHSYGRPASVEPTFRTQTLDVYNRPASVGLPGSYRTATYVKAPPPTIVVEDESSYQPELTNLDSPFLYNNQCHNNYGNQGYSATSGMDNGCMA